MKRIFRLTAIIAFLFISITTVQAQRRNARYNEYIKQYAPLAVEQMQRHKIPASITLAQGLLESGAGYSELARKSNNHFGIKCGGNWRGRTVRHDDDARNECFRAYRHPRESYEDHSDFLKRGARYAFLFKLKITDYKGWARGLKKAGYATDPSYANRLITIIERHQHTHQRDKRLSTSHIALQQAVHLLSRAYILTDFLQHPLLRIGQFKRKITRVEGIEHFPHPFKNITAIFPLTVFRIPQDVQLYVKKLLKLQPILCLAQYIRISGKVYIGQSIRQRYQMMPGKYGGRKGLG